MCHSNFVRMESPLKKVNEDAGPNERSSVSYRANENGGSLQDNAEWADNVPMESTSRCLEPYIIYN